MNDFFHLAAFQPARRRVFVAIALLAAFAACADKTTPETDAPRAPIDTGDRADWIRVSPAAVGLDPAGLAAARQYGFRDPFHTQAILVARHGYLVAEWYADGSGPDALAASWSVAKSITSTLIGQAIADGHIEGVEVMMTTFIPEWKDTDKSTISLRDVLAMSSGLDWIEDYEEVSGAAGSSDIAEMMLVDDPMRIAVEQPVRHPAGQVWSYSSGDTMLLGRVLRKATGKTAADLVQEKLAGPMQLRNLRWWRDAAGDTYTFCCVDATARDFAKFGQLFLQRGVWGGRELVAADWIAAATRSQAQSNPGYGYQWWLNHPDAADGDWAALPEDTYFALGHNGQYVAVFPKLDMVVVRLGEYVVPETTDWIAEHGLFGAGVFSDHIGPTGTRAPEGDWDDNHFFGLFVSAIRK